MPAYSFGQVIPVTGTGIGFPGSVTRQDGLRIAKARNVNSACTLNLNFGDTTVLIPDSTGGTWRSVADFIAAATANIGNVLAYWAGIALREVKTNLTYPVGVVPGSAFQTGYYSPGMIGEVVEGGSVAVLVRAGTPQANGAAYLRVVSNIAVSTVIGGIEAADDVAATTTVTANAASPTLTVASGTYIAVGQIVTAWGIPAGSYVTVVNGTTITINNNTLVALAAGTPIRFANTLAIPAAVFQTGVLDSNNVAELTLMRRQAA
jgi:hypothetical protein